MPPSIRHFLQTRPPGQILILYYAAAILVGTLLLATPWAANGEPLSLLDALFTATSAQCVTGLVVVDTGTKLTLFGQTVVLTLIQIGGLGIITFSVYLFIYLRLGVGMRGRWIIQETLLHTPVDSWQSLVRSIFILTLVIEGIGAALLAIVFIPEFGFLQGTYISIFHSISAFCNAGFSLFSNSLEGYRFNPLINLTIMGLIILGGIGFLVIRELLAFASPRGKRRARLSLHSRLVLLTSGLLIVFGTVMIYWLEAGEALAGMTYSEGLWVALFQSVSARTAGFNSIDLNAFRSPTLFLIIFLMFIGASPGSAGGGVKTTSLALFFGILYNRLRGCEHTNLFKRTVPEEATSKALALVLLAVVLIGIALFGLLIVQSPHLVEESPRSFLKNAFEAFSAFGTVGLSMGTTAELTVPGKVIVIVLMFIGRVGLLTIAFAIAHRRNRLAVRYSEANIMIG
ncbi:MAG: TrkH family potassium uptake protein [Desulfuromonadales bacterium]|nr:TrkH family potassium uptake protein [Desulfuromonadales bacterium]